MISLEKYRKLLIENITSEYKLASEDTTRGVIESEVKVSKSLGLDDRMEVPSKTNARITIKDTKPYFRTDTKCRLLNPGKVDSGKISKQILEKINSEARQSLKYNQWIKTDDVIKWFNNRDKSRRAKFIQFDIASYYPSISEDLLKKSLDFLKGLVNISQEQIDIIYAARKTLLYDMNREWIKKDGLWDVSIGSWDGAEVCEAVCLYLLHKLQHLNIPIGIYRDDGLSISYLSPRQNEVIKKKIVEIFKQEGLSITVEANLDSVDFLDVTLDLVSGIHKPYLKRGNRITYVHKHSNHPEVMLNAVPISVNKRLNVLSSNKEVFDQAKGVYQNALIESCFEYELHFD